MSTEPLETCTCGERHHPAANYYVSIADDGHPPRMGLLAGPFTTHAEALSWVRRTNDVACDVDPRAHFCGFGTVAMKPSYTKPGKLNHLLGISTET